MIYLHSRYAIMWCLLLLWCLLLCGYMGLSEQTGMAGREDVKTWQKLKSFPWIGTLPMSPIFQKPHLCWMWKELGKTYWGTVVIRFRMHCRTSIGSVYFPRVTISFETKMVDCYNPPFFIVITSIRFIKQITSHIQLRNT